MTRTHVKFEAVKSQNLFRRLQSSEYLTLEKKPKPRGMHLLLCTPVRAIAVQYSRQLHYQYGICQSSVGTLDT